jgi:hypothetical protein
MDYGGAKGAVLCVSKEAFCVSKEAHLCVLKGAITTLPREGVQLRLRAIVVAIARIIIIIVSGALSPLVKSGGAQSKFVFAFCHQCLELRGVEISARGLQAYVDVGV